MQIHPHTAKNTPYTLLEGLTDAERTAILKAHAPYRWAGFSAKADLDQ